ncbi:MAG: HAMP domain-containing sensor histidine kinase [Bacteroidota bacterium]
MKALTYLPYLWLTLALLILGIGIGQVVNLDTIREQVERGLLVGQEEIAHQVAEQLSSRYESLVKQELTSLSKRGEMVLPSPVSVQSTRGPTPLLPRIADRWAFVFPDSATQSWTMRSYFPGTPEQWRSNQEMKQLIQERLPQAYQHWGPQSQSFWENTIDSTLLLYQQDQFFGPLKQVACQPMFDPLRGNLLGFACIQVHPDLIQDSVLAPFFEKEFESLVNQRSDGIRSEVVALKIRTNTQEVLFRAPILNSAPLETQVPIDQLSPYLAWLVVQVGFVGTTSELVAQSLHRRNLWLVGGLTAGLLGLLGFIYGLNRQSSRLQQMKTDFVANLSHELKTPLSSIRLANASLRLGRTLNESQFQRMTELIEQESLKLERMVGRLLDFSRQESGQDFLNLQPMEVAEWWPAFHAQLRENIHLRGQQIRWQGEPPRGMLFADQQQIEEVVEILVDNALKYAPKSEAIWIQTHWQEEAWHLQVTDHGPGIPKRERARIFEPFVRLESVEVHTTKGHGLGLSLAKQIIEAHGGTISLRSKVGTGSTFEITLPKPTSV